MFDENGDSIIGYLPSKNQFVQVYFEELPQGEAGIKILGQGVQFAASILIRLRDADLEDWFDPIAIRLEFPDPVTLNRLLFSPDGNFELVDQYFEGLVRY